MLDELRRCARSSFVLRSLANNEKTAGLGKMIGSGAKRLAVNAAAHPLVTGVVGVGTAAALGKGRKTYAGFNPEAHKAMLGMS